MSDPRTRAEIKAALVEVLGSAPSASTTSLAIQILVDMLPNQAPPLFEQALASPDSPFREWTPDAKVFVGGQQVELPQPHSSRHRPKSQQSRVEVFPNAGRLEASDAKIFVRGQQVELPPQSRVEVEELTVHEHFVEPLPSGGTLALVSPSKFPDVYYLRLLGPDGAPVSLAPVDRTQLMAIAQRLIAQRTSDAAER